MLIVLESILISILYLFSIDYTINDLNMYMFQCVYKTEYFTNSAFITKQFNMNI